jgi:hypothetical protein
VAQGIREPGALADRGSAGRSVPTGLML